MTNLPLILPSRCESCIATVTHADFITEYAHESDCPNRKTA